MKLNKTEAQLVASLQGKERIQVQRTSWSAESYPYKAYSEGDRKYTAALSLVSKGVCKQVAPIDNGTHSSKYRYSIISIALVTG